MMSSGATQATPTTAMPTLAPVFARNVVHFVRVLVTTHGTLPQAEVSAIREAGYTERQVVEIALAVTSITFTNLVNRINDTELDFPPAP